MPSGGRALLGHEELVIDQVAYPALRVMSRWRAQAAADAALRRCGVEDLGQTPMQALSHAERVRVLLARALVREPRLVMMDEPTAGLSHTESERFLKLVQSLVRDGIAVLMTDDAEGSALVPGARVLTMQRGTLRGAEPVAAGRRHPARAPARRARVRLVTLRLERVSRHFSVGGETVRAVDDVSLADRAGQSWSRSTGRAAPASRRCC